MNDIQVALFKLTIELLTDTIQRVASLEQGEIRESEDEASLQAALQELLQQAQSGSTAIIPGEVAL